MIKIIDKINEFLHDYRNVKMYKYIENDKLVKKAIDNYNKKWFVYTNNFWCDIKGK